MNSFRASCAFLWPGVSLDQNLTVSRHAGFGEADAALQLQLDADDLLHSFVAEVGVLRRERRFRIDARDDGIEWLIRIGVEINARRLIEFDLADVAFGNKSA